MAVQFALIVLIIYSLLTLDQIISAVHLRVNPPQQNEQCETLHEGYSNTTTPPTIPLSSKGVAVKVIDPEEKSESKLLMLRNIDTDKLDSPRELKRMIFDQFGGDIVPGNLTFDVGYFRGNKCV